MLRRIEIKAFQQHTRCNASNHEERVEGMRDDMRERGWMDGGEGKEETQSVNNQNDSI
jgi:hypothetical protein